MAAAIILLVGYLAAAAGWSACFWHFGLNPAHAFIPLYGSCRRLASVHSRWICIPYAASRALMYASLYLACGM